MNKSIAAKLTQLSVRLEELNRLLSSESITANLDNYRKLTRERAEIAPATESQTAMPAAPKPPPLESWHYDPQLFRKWPQIQTESRGEGENLQEQTEGNEVSLGL